MRTTHGVGNPAVALPGIPATIDPQPVIAQMMRRASSSGFEAWWQRAQSVGFCAHPIQLIGTDEYGRQRVVWARCNNRRANGCPSCSDLYARDTWQLVAAGTTGGRHHIPESVSRHPQVFATLTAPSFGPVHSHTGRLCRDHRKMSGPTRCPHGKPLWCNTEHSRDDPMIGQALCTDCYDYLGHVLFTWHLPELWRRFTITLRRNLNRALKGTGVNPKSVRISFVKVVEMQARATPHIHALIRLDPTNPDPARPGDHDNQSPAATRGGGEHRDPGGPLWQPPLTAAELAALTQQSARSVSLDMLDPTADNPDAAAAATVRFGTQIDTQPLYSESTAVQHDSEDSRSEGRLSSHRVAGYLAKYVTKSLADFGISARRLSAEAIADLVVSEHVRAILTTISDLSQRGQDLGIDSLTGIGRWLHTLGYRGHITTKSRRYSTTMGRLRAIRATWARGQATKHAAAQQHPAPEAKATDDPMWWEFDRAGHCTPGDRTLVVSAALRHIHTRRTGLIESRALRDTGLPGAGDG